MTVMLAREKWQIATIRVLEDVFERRVAQVAQWGHNETLYDGTGPDVRWLLPFAPAPANEIEEALRDDYEDFREETGQPTWLHLVREELAEAFMESDPERLTTELLDVAALCVSWVEKLHERGARPIPS